MEQNWLDNVEYDVSGKMFLAAKFFRYKEQVTTLRNAVEHHFNNVMREISNGLPSISDEQEDSNIDYTFDGTNVGNKWTCRVCQVINQMSQN